VRAYAANERLAGSPSQPPIKITSIRHPTQVLFMYDGPYARPFWLYSLLLDVTDHHDGRANIAFVDGHVQAFSGMNAFTYVTTADVYSISMDPQY
jgi:prepilin-type processing-associated H-X9-DG protein